MEISIFKEIVLTLNTDQYDSEDFLTLYYKKLGNNVFKAAEYAQNNLPNMIEYSNQQIQSATRENVPFIFQSVSKSVVKFNPDYFPVCNLEKKLKDMAWQDFEDLSGILLQNCFGAVDVRVTQRSADGGLDFEGKLPFSSSLNGLKYGYIEVYGQSKKYTGNVGIYDVKSFVAFANSKKRNYVHPTQLFLFFTSSDYASNARKEITTNGFIALNGMQLGNLIYRYRAILKGKSPIIDQMLP